MSAVVMRPGPSFDSQTCRQIVQDILRAPQLQASNLAPRFHGTAGFSVRCTRTGLQRVVDDFASFAGFVNTLASVPGSNAYFINPLVLAPGTQVGPHVDTSLMASCGQRVHPYEVFVLYVQIPSGIRGGTLVLRAGGRVLERVTATSGQSLWFAGDLVHGVTRVVGRGPARISLVGEAYILPPMLLARIPEYQLDAG